MAISEELMFAADEVGIRLEMVGGIPVWEAHPPYKHQKAVDRIRAAIQPLETHDGQDCICYTSVAIRFPDGSQKRPDISIFCREPDEEDTEVTLLPEAVIEIISKGYEAKDTVIGVPFYKAQGIPDIVLFDPYTNVVTHIRSDEQKQYTSPVELEFACGCRCTV